MTDFENETAVSNWLLKVQKQPIIFSCNNCHYCWFSRSKLKKPTCPACYSHNTVKVDKDYVKAHASK